MTQTGWSHCTSPKGTITVCCFVPAWRLRPGPTWITSFLIQRKSGPPICRRSELNGDRVEQSQNHARRLIVQFPKSLAGEDMVWHVCCHHDNKECCTDHVWALHGHSQPHSHSVLAVLHALYIKATLWVWLDGGWDGLWPHHVHSHLVAGVMIHYF